MSRARADALRQRQLHLLLRSDRLRQRLGEQAQVLQQPLAWADRAQAAWHWMRAHPGWPVAGVAVLLVLRPRRALHWGPRLIWAWKALRRVQGLMDRAQTARP